MGGLRRYMPISWITFLIGTLSLVGTPFFSGFYSKEHVIEAAHYSTVWGSGFAYYATLIGVFVTSLYSFRVYFLVFHGKERFDMEGSASHDDHDDHGHHGGKPHESPWVVTLPLALLAIPSMAIGAWAVDALLFKGYFGDAIFIGGNSPAMATLAEHFHGWVAYGVHAFSTLPFWLMVAGLAAAWYGYVLNPSLPPKIYKAFSGVNRVLENKYFVDWFYENVLACGARRLGKLFWNVGDKGIIEGAIIAGSTRLVSLVAALSRLFQSGHIYHYAFAMIVGLIVLISFFVLAQ